MTPFRIIPLSFLCVILIGMILLLLPFSTAEGQSTSPLTALFTSTTSVCVTGLVVTDTYSHWTLFGKIVILALIQIGGLGVISVISAFPLLTGKRFTLRERILVHDALGVDTFRGLMRYLRRVFIGTFIVEGVGAFFYALVFVPVYGTLRGIWYGIFHAVSAFCNAGIDILGPDSLISWNDNPVILINTMMLIILGGLGYVVWFDIASVIRHSGRRVKTAAGQPGRCVLSEHTKLVLILTAVLIFGGAALVYLFECDNPDTLGGMPAGQRILNSLFQSVTFRTAGFASVPQGKLTDVTVLLGCALMFIGGSPTGTAGGIKTVTMFLVLLSIVSYVRRRRQAVVFHRSVTAEMREKAAAIAAYSMMVTIVLLIFLMALSPSVSLTDGLYEIFSATATVGLSRGITSTLTAGGKIVIILAMFLGRTGPISMAVFFLSGRSEKNTISYVDGRFIVG
jgi:potassium uptake TrkH family protein